MKAKRRHDLKQNVLGVELGRAMEFLRKRGTLLSWLLLLVALIILFVVSLRYWSNPIIHIRGFNKPRLREIQAQYDGLLLQRQDPDAKFEDLLKGFKEVAEQDDNLWVAAMACVTLGDEYAKRSILARGTMSQSEQKELLEQAAGYYKKVVQDFPQVTLAVAKAHMGLGSVYMDREDFEQAKAEYEAAQRLGGVVGGVIAELAGESLRNLDTLKAPVSMATTAPATKPATQPATAPSPRPATGPAPRAPATVPAGDKPATMPSREKPPPGEAAAQPASAPAAGKPAPATRKAPAAEAQGPATRGAGGT